MISFKHYLIKLFIKFLKHELVQKQLNAEFYARNKKTKIVANQPLPYTDLQQRSNDKARGSGVVIITGRFRSGSTLLWNVFRQIDICTAYYEPFNERRWFDNSSRGEHVDETHIGVNDYWKEYEGINQLTKYYDENWIRQELLMDEHSWNPKMLAYIDCLISNAKGIPVLQFNRIDFRLPWIRHNYPNGNIVHLYRNPRDQWLSFLKDKSSMNKNDVERTYVDNFYLDIWCDDLAKFFPFLSASETPHPYRRFYYIWKLSYLYGKEYADISICFEDLIDKPREVLNNLFDIMDIAKDIPWDSVLNIIHKPKVGKWKDYADDSWFSQHETECETTLSSYLETGRCQTHGK